MEAAYPLYGHEIDDRTTPPEAGLSWIVKMEKGEFIGREALRTATPPRKRLVGLEVKEGGIPRQGYPVFLGDEEIGRITSGTYSPWFEKGIAIASVREPLTKETLQEKRISIEIRGKKREGVLTPLPFYKRTA